MSAKGVTTSTQNNKANKLVNHVKNWVNIIVTAGNGTLSNSVALDLQSEQTPNPPSSTIPSLTTKATSVSSSVSNIDAVYKKTHREVPSRFQDKPDHQCAVLPGQSKHCVVGDRISVPVNDEDNLQVCHPLPAQIVGHHNIKLVVSTTITHANPESDDKFDQSIFKVAYTTSLPVQIASHHNVKQAVSTTIPHANPESDDEFGQSIVEAAQTSLKHKHTSHNSTEYITSEVEEMDDDGSDISIYDRNAKPESGVTTLTKISINKPVKKAKTSNDLQHGATDTLAEDLGHNFGSTAIALVAHFLVLSSNNAETDEPSTTQTICNELLEDFAFLYQDLDAMIPANAFQSHFILHLLASVHLWSCIGCSNISRLSTDMLTEQGIKEAIALCCSVLKCAIHLFESSDLQVDDQNSTCGKPTLKTPLKLNKISRKESSNSFAFSEQHWGPCTWQYVTLITKHDDAVLKDIVAMANALIMPSMMEMSEDSSFQGDQMAEDIAKAAAQCINLIFMHYL
ncbi:hypothetical protein J3A83DRAFT_4376600 [Scleroderma citrinum]